MKNLTVTLSLENKRSSLEKVLNSVHKKVYEPCGEFRYSMAITYSPLLA